MARNLTVKQKATVELILDALRKLENKDGVTVTEIANYLISEHGLTKKTALNAVRMTLTRGVAFGVIDRVGKTYSLDFDFADGIYQARRRRRTRTRRRRRRRGAKRGRRRRGRRSKRRYRSSSPEELQNNDVENDNLNEE